MKITIITVGTRGDVQPYIAVAEALKARGHEPTLAASPEHTALVAAHGIPFKPFGPSFRDILQSDLGRAWLTSADSPVRYGRLAKELFLPLQRRWLEDTEAAVEGAEAILFYVLAAGGLYAAERRKLPAVALAPLPLFPSRDLAPVGAPFLERAPGVLKLAAGHLVAEVAFGPISPPHDRYRRSVGLPGLAGRDFVSHVGVCGVPSVSLFSPSVVPRPTDWAPRHEVAGFAFVRKLPYEPPSALADFLASGPPPIYIGFGSMTGFAAEELADLAARAAALAKVRAVVASGWAGLAPKPSDTIYVIDEVPHEWLFPRVAAVVHHGGVGTFAEGLRAGKPTVIAAFFGDQPFWGRRNEQLGTGPKALRRKGITAHALARAIRSALDDHDIGARAAAMGARIRAENGADRAAEIIERRLLQSG